MFLIVEGEVLREASRLGKVLPIRSLFCECAVGVSVCLCVCVTQQLSVDRCVDSFDRRLMRKLSQDTGFAQATHTNTHTRTNTLITIKPQQISS